jgi:hypothetical protein
MLGAAHGHVVDRAVDGERADVAAGKEQRRYHIAVGGHDHAAARDVERGLIVALPQPIIVQGLMKNVRDQLRHRPAAGAVRQVDVTVGDVELAPVGLHAHDALRTSSRKRP